MGEPEPCGWAEWHGRAGWLANTTTFVGVEWILWQTRACVHVNGAVCLGLTSNDMIRWGAAQREQRTRQFNGLQSQTAFHVSYKNTSLFDSTVMNELTTNAGVLSNRCYVQFSKCPSYLYQ